MCMHLNSKMMLGASTPFGGVWVEHGLEQGDHVSREPCGHWVLCPSNLLEQCWQAGLIKRQIASHNHIQKPSCSRMTILMTILIPLFSMSSSVCNASPFSPDWLGTVRAANVEVYRSDTQVATQFTILKTLCAKTHITTQPWTSSQQIYLAA